LALLTKKRDLTAAFGSFWFSTGLFHRVWKSGGEAGDFLRKILEKPRFSYENCGKTC
jgi:hypothetical protein